MKFAEMTGGYQKGDTVIFEAVEGLGLYLPVNHPINSVKYEITYVLSGWGIKNGYVVFAIKRVE